MTQQSTTSGIANFFCWCPECGAWTSRLRGGTIES
ncbi:hypothetical protein GQ607_005751 [Colletotrichum asianum]|uniref:Uncharacterized protein n=1 Tax=Colletotrichum asianum TaxID=702518 RepID=A0A8H3WM06_9PEZI|nr:hypothetical protein GQ607_005751 [Colletotrichum asianum]